MAEALISKKLLNDVRDLLNDQERVKVKSDGLIYRRFTEGQMYFMETLKTSKIPWPVILFEDIDDYPLPANILEIVDWHFSRDELNPLFEMPRGAVSTVRALKITNPPVETPLGTSETTDTDNMKRDGDILTLDVFWKPNDDDEIDSENDPVLDRTFHKLLVDYALSFYRDFKYMRDDKEIRDINGSFSTKEEVFAAVRRKRDVMYNLNSIQGISANFIRM